MSNRLTRIRNIGNDRNGSAVVEFAFAVMPLAMLMVAIIEFGTVMFTSVLMESGLRSASRYGITGYELDGKTRMERIIEIVTENTLGLVDMETAQFEVLVYPSYGDIGRGEAFVDGNGNGTYDPGETFTDENDNHTWDADIGEAGAGESGDIVVYRIRYDWPLMTPFAGTFVGTDGTVPLKASIAVRNEPWDTGS